MTDAPLPPVAACGRGPVAEALAARAKTGPWSTVRFDDYTVVVGDDLPWVDGVVYLGAMPDAAGVLVPVHWRPTLPADVVLSAVRRATGGAERAAFLPDGAGAADILVLDEVRW